MPAGAWQRPTKEAFLDDPITYLEELYDKLWSEIYEPVWRAQGTATVLNGATTVAVAVEIDRLPYHVALGPSWSTTAWVTNKTTAGFTINVGTAPVGDQPIDYIVICPDAGVV